MNDFNDGFGNIPGGSDAQDPAGLNDLYTDNRSGDMTGLQDHAINGYFDQDGYWGPQTFDPSVHNPGQTDLVYDFNQDPGQYDPDGFYNYDASQVAPMEPVFDRDTGLWDLPNYDPNAYHANVIGDPGVDMQVWHEQTHPDTCAVVSQEYVLEELTGYDFSEDQLREMATSFGWYEPGVGTPMDHVGDLLQAYGIPVEHTYGATIDDISARLAEHEKVIVSVNSAEIWNPGVAERTPLEQFFGIPGQPADHAVEVIGLDYSDPQRPMVVLNDPGHPDGMGMIVPAEEFEAAWATGGNMLVSTNVYADGVSQHSLQQSVSMGEMPALRGYYNSDGTYHYTSDNTDRDPETGAIVRRW